MIVCYVAFATRCDGLSSITLLLKIKSKQTKTIYKVKVQEYNKLLNETTKRERKGFEATDHEINLKAKEITQRHNLKDRVAVSLKLKYLLHKKATGKTADITQDANL